MVRCSRCGKEIPEMGVKLESSIRVFKISETGVPISYNNLSEPTSEFLCKECFDKYCDCLDQLNKEYESRSLVDFVQVVDDVQYN